MYSVFFKADMTKRTQLNRWKKNVLKDLNMFVSPLRLCVRNLPNHLTKDAALRVIIKKHCNDPNAKVTGTEMTANAVENRRFDQCVLDWTSLCKSRLP